MYFKLNKVLCLIFLYLGVWLYENGVLGVSFDGFIWWVVIYNYNY